MRISTIPLAALFVLAVCAFATPASAATLLEGQRTGGIAGVNDQLTITTKGVVTVTTRGEKQPRYRLTSRWLARVKRHVKAARKAGLRGAYGENNVADGFVYSFEFAGRRVVAQGFRDWPPSLNALVADFGRLHELATD